MKSYDQFYGMKFSRLTVNSFSHQTRSSAMMHVTCDCGEIRIVRLSAIKLGCVKSCGCLTRDNLIERNTKHGMYYTLFYKVYDSIIQRCTNPNNKCYHLYGGKGIKCEWKTFDEFKEDMYDRYREGLSIDRIDGNKNYCKSNCQWVKLVDQQRNKSNNRFITYKGKTKCVAEWAALLGINRHQVLKLDGL